MRLTARCWTGSVTRRRFVGALACPLWGQAKSILVHEHILVDFIGADRIGPGRYDPEDVFRVARPKLEEVRKLGCVRLQECTPNFLGRDPRLCRRLAEATGIEIWTNTGLYGAANHKFVPGFARSETADQLARRWIAEFEQGIEGVQPRFIKTGVNKAPLDELDRKLVRAAALASRATGLTVASHTGDGAAALEQLEILAEERVPAGRFVWVHAQNEKDHRIHERVARAGAWVEFDGVGPKSIDWHLECVRFMAAAGLLGWTLISQDAGWYHVGEPGGGDYRGYTFLYTDFLPRLEPEWIDRLLWDNPLAAFG
jgi:phosphotriesterase-related protein